MGLGRVRTYLTADPDADPQLVEFVRTLLVDGGSAVRGLGSVSREQAQHYEELTEEDIAGDGPGQPAAAVPERAGHIAIEVVVLLRTELAPSREVSTTHRVARRLAKPVHLLIAPGINAGVDADEVHLVEIDPGWDLLQELRRWSVSLPERFGRPEQN